MITELTYGLTDDEWYSIIRLPAQNLLPCCPAVEELRGTLSFMYCLGIGVDTVDNFLYQYDKVCSMHDMSYSPLLRNLAERFRFSYCYQEYYYG